MSDLAAAFRRARVLDASPELRAGMPLFPGHPRLEIDPLARTHERDGYFLQTLTLGEHTGSHIDAPAHAGGRRQTRTIRDVPGQGSSRRRLRGLRPCRALDRRARPPGVGGRPAGPPERGLDGLRLEPGDAALIHFGWDRYFAEPNGWWAANTPGLGEDACAYLREPGSDSSRFGHRDLRHRRPMGGTAIVIGPAISTSTSSPTTS